MSSALLPAGYDDTLEQIEETILPSLSLVLDAMLDATALARPGHDAEVFAAELRTIGHALEALNQEVEALLDARIAPQLATASAA